MATYQATVRILFDAEAATEAVMRLRGALDEAEWVLDFRIDRITEVSMEVSDRITAGTIRDGDAFA